MRRLLCFKHLFRVALGLGLCTGLVLISLAVPVPVPQGPNDPAELLPSSTGFFLEFSQPQPVIQEVSALLKGSALEDMPAFLAQLRDKLGDEELSFWADQSYSMLGTFLGPEGLAEARRLKAGCVALTGFDKNHNPEFLWVLLAGESNLPGFFMRAVLTSDRNMRSIEKVAGVNLYRQLNWRPRFRDKDKDKDKKGFVPPEEPDPETKYYGPTYALMPGMLLAGSTPATVRDALLRSRGLKSEQNLAQSLAFQKMARLRDRPGLFAYADLGLLASQADRFFEDARQGFPPGRAAFNPSFWNVTKALTNPKGLRTCAASLTLQKSGLDLQAQVLSDPGQDIPLLGVLPNKDAGTEALHFAPANSLAALTFSLNDGSKHWDKLLELANTVFQASGEDAKAPDKAIEGLEEKLKVRFGKDIFGKLTDVTLVMGMPALPRRPVGKDDQPPGREDEAASGAVPLLVVLKTSSVEAAKSLETVLLESVRLIGGDEKLLPASREIQDQVIRSLPAARGRRAIHHGRHGATLVIGLDAKAVADSLVAGTKKQGLLAQPSLAESLKGLEAPVLAGVGSLNRTIQLAMRARTTFPLGEEDRPGLPARANREAVDKLIGVFAQSTEEMPPAVLSLSRKPGVLNLRLHQTGLQGVTPQTVDTFLEWNLRQQIGEDFRFRKDFGDKDKARFAKDKDVKDKLPPREPPDKDKGFKDKDKGFKDKDR